MENLTCPKCSGKMTLLFVSAVCDRCDPPKTGGEAQITGKAVSSLTPEEFLSQMCTYLNSTDLSRTWHLSLYAGKQSLRHRISGIHHFIAFNGKLYLWFRDRDNTMVGGLNSSHWFEVAPAGMRDIIMDRDMMIVIPFRDPVKCAPAAFTTNWDMIKIQR